MTLVLIHASTAVYQQKQVYQMIGSGSNKRLEPVTILHNLEEPDIYGNNLPYIIKYSNGNSHQIGYNWYFYVIN